MNAARRKKPSTAEPSAAAMREMPEFDFSKSSGRGREGMRKALEMMRAAKRGRPRLDVASPEMKAKSIRLPAWVWVEIGRRAKKQKTTDNAVVRDAIALWLEQTSQGGR